MRTDCCGCHQLMRGDPTDPEVSHGICPACQKKLYPICPVCKQLVDTKDELSLHDEANDIWYHHACAWQAAEAKYG